MGSGWARVGDDGVPGNFPGASTDDVGDDVDDDVHDVGDGVGDEGVPGNFPGASNDDADDADDDVHDVGDVVGDDGLPGNFPGASIDDVDDAEQLFFGSNEVAPKQSQTKYLSPEPVSHFPADGPDARPQRKGRQNATIEILCTALIIGPLVVDHHIGDVQAVWVECDLDAPHFVEHFSKGFDALHDAEGLDVFVARDNREVAFLQLPCVLGLQVSLGSRLLLLTPRKLGPAPAVSPRAGATWHVRTVLLRGGGLLHGGC